MILAQSDQGELSGESCEFLLDFFSDYQVTRRPLASNLKATFVQVANNELLSKPAMAMDGMKEGLQDGDFENLWNFSKEDVSKMYHMMQLTPQRVIAMLAEEPSAHLNKSRAKIFSYLKKYIRYLSHKELGRFLCYITGSPVPVMECIKMLTSKDPYHTLPHIPVQLQLTCLIAGMQVSTTLESR